MSEPKTPSDVYKAIIDQLVNETRLLGPASHVAELGVFSKAPDHSNYNQFLSGLTGEQRKLVSQMLQETCDGAIHDLLAMLTWWITVRDVGLTYQGTPMPVELSGMGLHGDFIGRLNGWEWPTED